jgi:hypothetical protein
VQVVGRLAPAGRELAGLEPSVAYEVDLGNRVYHGPDAARTGRKPEKAPPMSMLGTLGADSGPLLGIGLLKGRVQQNFRDYGCSSRHCTAG